MYRLLLQVLGMVAATHTAGTAAHRRHKSELQLLDNVSVLLTFYLGVMVIQWLLKKVSSSLPPQILQKIVDKMCNNQSFSWPNMHVLQWLKVIYYATKGNLYSYVTKINNCIFLSYYTTDLPTTVAPVPRKL